jgi:hypothetical protein
MNSSFCHTTTSSVAKGGAMEHLHPQAQTAKH